MTIARAQAIARELGDLAAAAWNDAHDAADACRAILQELDRRVRRPWLAHVIEKICEGQGGLCAICNDPLALGTGEHHVDHKIPFYWGGGNERSNLQIAHARCNREKGAVVDLRELISYLEDRYMNLGR